MKKQKNNLDDAINALKNESVPSGPPQEVIDTTLQKLMEASPAAITKKITITERIKTMKNFTKLAAAAVIIIAVALSINILDKSIPTASAAQVLQEAIDAVSGLWSVHIEARMRTLPADNFMHLDLDRDFVPIRMWKDIDQNGVLKWRIQKPYRYAVMDGEEATMVIRDSWAVKGRCREFYCFDLRWLGQMLNIDKLLENELQNAQQPSRREYLVRYEKINDVNKIVLEVESFANVPADDYLRNKFISDSDNLRVYYFDAQTKLLQNLEIYVHVEDEDVLVFEITNIELNTEIDPGLFKLDLSENVVWFKPVEILPDNEKYEQMSPKEAATVFFQACADENWEEYLKFNAQSHVPQRTKDHLGGLEIIIIGEPFQSKGYGGWFVPYEIRLRSGHIKQHNLALRKDNPANRYQVDGGL
jgi:outer membrane lipoprotein-sorting protein